MTVQTKEVTLNDISFSSEKIDLEAIKTCYDEFGCFVIKGFNKKYVEPIHSDIQKIVKESYGMLNAGGYTETDVGRITENGAIFLPAHKASQHDRQIMTVPINYKNSAAFCRSAFDERVIEINTTLLGPNVELFMEGQALYKEPGGGHPKKLHQDSSYFEHKYEGPLAQLTYAIDTDFERGALHVVPGSHKSGLLEHTTTFSHLGLDEKEWTLDKAVCIEGKAGDAIFFHVNCIHGSPENHSDVARPVFINRWRRADDFIVAGGTMAHNRKDNQQKTKQAREYNMMIAGYREGGLG